MATLDWILTASAFAAALAWALLALYVLRIQRRRRSARATLSAVIAALQGPSIADRSADVEPLLAGASRELAMQAAIDERSSPAAVQFLCTYLTTKWGVATLERDADTHRSPRDKWRRMAALRILVQMSHPKSLDLVAKGLGDADADVASVALSLLGRSSDPRATDFLIEALKRQRHAAPRIAAELDRSPRPTLVQLKPLLQNADPVVRFWGATLLGRYSDADGIEYDLAKLAEDPDARVRQAAIETLGKVGDDLAATCASRLLTDPAPSVRADAARALGVLMRTDLADKVSVLLGDADWAVRRAAKESLEALGTEVWPVLVRCLDHHDRFVRNGAAEVFQNLGVLDSLVVMEAATDDPTDKKVHMLRRIVAAGGVRLTDSLIERSGPVMGPRIRALIEVMGLEHVGAA